MSADTITAQLIMDEAVKRGWRVEHIGSGSRKPYFRISLPDGRSEIFCISRPSRSSANGAAIVRFKRLSMQFVEMIGYKTPPISGFSNMQDAEHFLREHGTVVVKPSNGTNSQGVTIGITDTETLKKALDFARVHSSNGKAILQKQLEGKLFRLTVVNGKFVAGAYRRGAFVAGDGVNTVRSLVESFNQDPRRNNPPHSPLKQVEPATVEAYLGSSTMEMVPSAGAVVRIAAIESISAGGDTVDATSQVHEDWQKFTEDFARAAGLFIAGFDVITEDIASPLVDSYVPLLEVNSAPGFISHQYPSEGTPIELAPILLDELFE
jgi:cyanophycin synthetase